jgi:site-specific DNA recombinase
MSTDSKAVMRCAIYTRKSSEEGLEQSFNSLDAQREAGEAFILSQRHEGWRVSPTRYDDGGFSGGSMDRPALKRLLEDVKANKVNVIVVYKVDRLTRSLSDFAKIVEALDAKGVSFVSVTQQFNTTTSMGRLTLNILLSFAQFEREVTGERIRDKIAASKKKGMWMGGQVPLGYSREGRKLIPHPTEAELVRRIFAIYLKLGCVLQVQAQLKRENVTTKSWVTKKGAKVGGASFARGHLYYLLSNRLYVGEIRHGDRWYPGEHTGIVSQELWEKVQTQLNSNRRVHRNRAGQRFSGSLLSGLMEDGKGKGFGTSFTVKRGKRYRYYVSRPPVTDAVGQSLVSTRLPAHEFDSRVSERLQAFLTSDAQVFDELGASGESPAVLHRLGAGAKKLAGRVSSLPADDLRDLFACILQRVIVQENSIQVLIRKSNLRHLLEHEEWTGAASLKSLRHSTQPAELIGLTIEAKRKRYGGEVHLVVPPNSTVPVRHPRPALIKAVARGHAWCEKVIEGKIINLKSLASETGLTTGYVRKVLVCGLLAPDIVAAILEGRQPLTLKFEHLYKNIPLSWAEQRRTFGFPSDAAQ